MGICFVSEVDKCRGKPWDPMTLGA